MNKFNKKGFTLIEMLVVIAIIAVLVSIIIPTVTSATDKAGAATNAANLRSIKAEVVTAILTNDDAVYTMTKDATTGKVTSITCTKALPEAKKCGVVTKDAVLSVGINGDDVGVYFVQDNKTYSIDSFAKMAEGEDLAPASTVIGTPAALKKAG